MGSETQAGFVGRQGGVAIAGDTPCFAQVKPRLSELRIVPYRCGEVIQRLLGMADLQTLHGKHLLELWRVLLHELVDRLAPILLLQAPVKDADDRIEGTGGLQSGRRTTGS